MLKNKFAVLGIISLMLYAVVEFCKNALETAFRIKLITSTSNYSSSDYVVNTQSSQQLLLALATICFAFFIAGAIFEIVHKRKGK